MLAMKIMTKSHSVGSISDYILFQYLDLGEKKAWSL